MAKGYQIKIVVIKNGLYSGFLESISYTNGTYKLTQDEKEAKGYSNVDRAIEDIDYATLFGYTDGCIFIMD